MTKNKLNLQNYWIFRSSIIVSMKCGKRSVPVEKLKILAEVYDVSIDYIVELTDETAAYTRKKKRLGRDDKE